MAEAGPEAEAALVAAVALALSGEQVTAPGAGSATPAAVADALAAAGWDAERLQELRAGCQAEGRAWPFTVPRELVAPAGFGRFGALLKQVRAELGLDGLVTTVHHGPKVIGAAEQRLLAERPPHHGNVG